MDYKQILKKKQLYIVIEKLEEEIELIRKTRKVTKKYLYELLVDAISLIPYENTKDNEIYNRIFRELQLLKEEIKDDSNNNL